MILFLLFSLMSVPAIALAEPVLDSSAVQAQSTRTAPLTIEEVFARIELNHPLLQATGLRAGAGSGESPESVGCVGAEGSERARVRPVSNV